MPTTRLGRGRHLDVVGDQDERAARLVQLVHQAHDVAAETESRLPVGSSARIRSGSVTRARATATRCCWPPESSPGPVVDAAGEPDAARGPRWRAPCAPLSAYAGIGQGELDVLPRRHGGEQVELLEHEADASVADLGQGGLAHVADVFAGQVVATRRSGVSRQPRMCMRVDLPEPEGPMMATYSPWLIDRLTPRNAATLERSRPVDLGDPLQLDHGVVLWSHRGSARVGA